MVQHAYLESQLVKVQLGLKTEQGKLGKGSKCVLIIIRKSLVINFVVG